MARLFGRDWTRRELLMRVGDLAQLAGVTELSLRGGRQQGMRAVEARTGTGLRFLVLPDRGMDIAAAEYGGLPLAWRSPTGATHAAYYEPEGFGWLRSFDGGLLVTCGLTYLGSPGREDPSWSRATGAPSSDPDHIYLGLHGRVANLPASHVWADGAWEGDTYHFWIQGKVREAVVFGENVQLTRRISARMGDNHLLIDDVVENLSFDPVPHMILYHVNGGFPVVDEGSELVCTSRAATPRDEDARAGLQEWSRFQAPTAGFREQVFYHQMDADGDGFCHAALINKSLDAGRGLGLYVRYRRDQLPFFVQWKMNHQGVYVCGLEPANCHVEGRAAEREQYGSLQMLEGGERREYHLEVGVLADQEEIACFEERVRQVRCNGDDG